jgi:ribosomal protein L4
VFAFLGRMVIKKIRADSAALQNGARQNGAGQSGAGQNGAGQARVGRGRAGRRAAGQDRVAGPVDEKTRQWISDVVRTPRQ